MSDPQGQLWSDNPNAPKISRTLYLDEKADFAGNLIASILYGVVIVVFFRCISALFDPVYRKGERIKWWLVCYTVVMFSFATAFAGVNLDILSISFIDNRGFPGVESELPPGPYGYQLFISPSALNVVANTMFTLSNWLADGPLLYRCYVIYSKNFWVIAFPCLMYLSSLVMGVMLIRQSSQMPSDDWPAIPYFSISISLDLLLTFMIAIRLMLYARNTRTAVGMAGIGGLCKAIVTMLIESSTLYAVNSLLFVIPWATGSHAAQIFLPILAETQVLAPLLIIQRVANKSALTSTTVASGHLSSFKARSGGKLTGDGSALSGGDVMNFVDEHGMNSVKLSVTTVSSSN